MFVLQLLLLISPAVAAAVQAVDASVTAVDGI
jgi:hypothetical protein